ncbi:hypothetical protein [Helicobacter saguini]|nr:hypothetical protein [Helicobacter saguini]
MFRKLYKKESGLYIFDEFLYQDIRANRAYNDEEVKTLPNR